MKTNMRNDEIFKDLLLSDILKNGNEQIKLKKQYEALKPELQSKLNQYLISDSSNFSFKPWLKSRIFETLIFSKGLSDYLEQLLDYEDLKPETDIQMNSLLVSSLILTSLNPFIYELLNGVSNSKVGISIEHKKAILNLLKSSRDFTVKPDNITFNIDQVERIRSEILRKSLDILSKHENTEKNQNVLQDTQNFQKIPSDLVKIGAFESQLSVNQIISFTKKFKSLDLEIRDGYLIWSFKNKPTIFIRDKKAYYSPKFSRENKKTTRKMAELQLYVILEKLESGIKRPSIVCALCNSRFTDTLVYHEQKGVIPVCPRCSVDSSVIAIVSKLESKNEQTTLV